MILVGEHVLRDLVGQHVGLAAELDKEDHTALLRVEAELLALDVNITLQNVVENDIFDEGALVILFIIQVFDIGKRNGNERRGACRRLVVALHKHDLIEFGALTDCPVCIPVQHDRVARIGHLLANADARLADLGKLTASDHNAALIDHADHTVGCVPHLMDHTLIQSI